MQSIGLCSIVFNCVWLPNSIQNKVMDRVWFGLIELERFRNHTKFGIWFYLIAKLSQTQSTDRVWFCSIEFDIWKFYWLCWKNWKVELLWSPIHFVHSVFLKRYVLHQKKHQKFLVHTTVFQCFTYPLQYKCLKSLMHHDKTPKLPFAQAMWSSNFHLSIEK